MDLTAETPTVLERRRGRRSGGCALRSGLDHDGPHGQGFWHRAGRLRAADMAVAVRRLSPVSIMIQMPASPEAPVQANHLLNYSAMSMT